MNNRPTRKEWIRIMIGPILLVLFAVAGLLYVLFK